MKGALTAILMSAMFCTCSLHLTGINSRVQAEQVLRNSKHLLITPAFKSKERLVSVGVRLNF